MLRIKPLQPTGCSVVVVPIQQFIQTSYTVSLSKGPLVMSAPHLLGTNPAPSSHHHHFSENGMPRNSTKERVCPWFTLTQTLSPTLCVGELTRRSREA